MLIVLKNPLPCPNQLCVPDTAMLLKSHVPEDASATFRGSLAFVYPLHLPNHLSVLENAHLPIRCVPEDASAN